MKRKSKKLHIVLIFAATILFISVVVYVSRYSNRRIYYNPTLMYKEYQENKTTTPIKGTTPSIDQYSLVESTFNTLIDYYKITNKKMPNVLVISNEQISSYFGSSSIDVKAFYDHDTQTIYLAQSFSLKDQPVIAHELCHYLSDNESYSSGLIYIHDGQILGNAFNEGITNYLSTKLYPFDNNSCIYEYETHVASIIAESYGEQNLIDAYFSSDISNLKNDFNEKISFIYPNKTENGINFTPFDVFVSSLQTYNVCLFHIDERTDFIDICMSQVDSVEEMILNYSIESLQEEKAQKLLKSMLENEDSIGWTTYSNLSDMLK